MTADVHVQDCGVREREMEGDGGRERYRCSVVSVKSLVRPPRVARADRSLSLR